MDQQNVVKLDGRLTVERAVQLKEILLKEIGRSDDIVVDCSSAIDMDVSFLQILYAASRFCESNKKKFALSGRCSEVMKKVLRKAGFCHAGDVCEDASACLWLVKMEKSA